MPQSRPLLSRPWIIALAGLILTAAVTSPFFFVTSVVDEIIIAAVLSVAVAILVGLLAIRHDRAQKDRLSEQQRVRDELAEADRKYRDLTDSLPLVTWVYAVGDRNDTRLVSAQIESTLGYAPDQWDGELLKSILHPDDRNRVLEEIALAMESGSPFDTEYRVRTRTGEVVWLREHARTISRRCSWRHAALACR